MAYRDINTKILSICFIVIFHSFLYSAGTVTGDFLLVNIFAKETALGGIYSSLYANPESSIINPATLSGIKDRYIVLGFYKSVFDTIYQQSLYAQNINNDNFFSLFFMYDTTLNLTQTDEEGYTIRTIENYDILLGGAYSFFFLKNISIGINTKIILSKIYKNTTYGINFNLGFLYKNEKKNYLLGADIENIGISSAYFKEHVKYPIIIRASYGGNIFKYKKIYDIWMYIEERIFLNELETTETSFGMEAIYIKTIFFRYGYIFGKKEGRTAIGIGIKVKNFYLDYAYQPFFLSDNAHRFTLKIIF